jgi:regulator of replication initiation timing
MPNTSGNKPSFTTSPAKQAGVVPAVESAAQKVQRLKEENEALTLELENAKLRIALRSTQKQLETE